MTDRQVFPAPAKLNLFLHVVGRRADGYHLLQTAFTFLDFSDELRFEVRQDGRVERITDLPDVPADSDLVVRAALLLKRATGCRLGVSISLQKRIPLGSGLGGGSSDAATTLIALNRLWHLDLLRSDLQSLSLELGADVPLFVFGQSAFAEGVGEVLSPLPLPPRWYLVLTPDVHVSTKEIFADPDLTRDSIAIKIQDFSFGAGRNDLEPVARRRYPKVAQCLEWLENYTPARMTGSGAAVFADFSTRAEAEQVFARKPSSLKGFLAQALAAHPLREF